MMAGDARRHQERYEAMGAQPVRKPRTTVTDPSPCKMEGAHRACHEQNVQGVAAWREKMMGC